ncbi:iron ABC transporter permease [Kocuria polaris]|nr:iron ABC transporter permease [Kocuria polaris]
MSDQTSFRGDPGHTIPRSSAGVAFGYDARTLHVGPHITLRLHTRAALICAALLIVGLACAVFAIHLGDLPLTPRQVLEVFLGGGSDFERRVVLEWRLPVAIAALIYGALLAAGGGIFQSLTRNPLGSPDVIGFDAGSYTAVVITILFLGNSSYWSVATAAIVGGLLTALLVYALAWRRGMQGFRLIVVGIGVSAILGSINAYLITRADTHDGMAVGFWGAGSLTRVGWHSLGPSLVIAVLLFAAAYALSPALRQLELGDDAAMAQGVTIGRSRLALIVVGVATSALVTAAAGPIGFVALAAPQLARRLVRSPGVSLGPAACMGAALLAAAHLLSLVIARAFQPVPVGLITVCLGGIYLIWLLIRETRTSS